MAETKHEGLPVLGYRPQSGNAVELVNHNKQMEEAILRAMDMMVQSSEIDQRWLAIGRTHIEQGFMAWNRAIFRPSRVELTQELSNGGV